MRNGSPALEGQRHYDKALAARLRALLLQTVDRGTVENLATSRSQNLNALDRAVRFEIESVAPGSGEAIVKSRFQRITWRGREHQAQGWRGTRLRLAGPASASAGSCFAKEGADNAGRSHKHGVFILFISSYYHADKIAVRIDNWRAKRDRQDTSGDLKLVFIIVSHNRSFDRFAPAPGQRTIDDRRARPRLRFRLFVNGHEWGLLHLGAEHRQIQFRGQRDH